MTGSFGCSERAGDAAAYALGALEPSETEDFLRHIDGCVVCRDELLQFGQIADVLAMAVPQYEVPGRLRRAVLREISGAADPRRAPARRLGARPTWGRLPRWGGALAGALAAVLIAVLVLGGSGSPASRTVAAQVIGVPGSAQLRLTGSRAELIVAHMRQPVYGDIYEVWKQRGRGPLQPTTALFSVTSTGSADVTVPGGVRADSRILVTEEPAGGSRHPTHRPVIAATLS